jgi:hypothetical protein
MKVQPKGSQAARLRQRKYQLIARYNIPDDLLPGSLSQSHQRCGKPNCRCTRGQGHAVWSLTFMVEGKKRVLHIPQALAQQVQRRVKAGKAYQDAVREVLAANAQLLALARKQRLL